jgi:lipid-binding SYLF domain-containing protein
MKRTTVTAVGLLSLVAVAGSACSDYHEGGGDQTATMSLQSQADSSISDIKQRDPSIQKFFDNAYGYVVFPKIAKGAAGIGAANGEGVVFEQGVAVGTSEMTQITVGLQLGGQSYSEFIFFQDKAHLDVFKGGNMEFAANASAVAVKSGAAASNDFSNGMAVFTMPRAGLMFEASIGGQKFSYRPIH